MLKSRLRCDHSHFDGTCNPDTPHHWFKRFLDTDADIYQQQYTIEDGTLSQEKIDELKKEYQGTVYYDRFIRGIWKSAEGVIYTSFANDPERYIIDEAPPIVFATIGVDFGGNGSAHAFSCTGFTYGMKEVITLEEYYHKGIMSPAELERAFIDFVQMCQSKYRVSEARCDSAEQVLIKGLKNACATEHVPINIYNAKKGAINDRIRFYCRLQAKGRYKIMRHCKRTIEAFETATWDGKSLVKDVRLDDGTYNIDSLDAQEYSTEPYMGQVMDIW